MGSLPLLYVLDIYVLVRAVSDRLFLVSAKRARGSRAFALTCPYKRPIFVCFRGSYSRMATRVFLFPLLSPSENKLWVAAPSCAARHFDRSVILGPMAGEAGCQDLDRGFTRWTRVRHTCKMPDPSKQLPFFSHTTRACSSCQ